MFKTTCGAAIVFLLDTSGLWSAEGRAWVTNHAQGALYLTAIST